MKKSKALAAIAIAAVTVVTGVALAGCGESGSANKSYSITLDSADDSSANYAALSAWEYIPVPYQMNGQPAGTGFVNLDVWGAKKFKLDSNDSIFGTGLKYTLKVDVSKDIPEAIPDSVTVSGDNYYAFAIDAHVIGEGDQYEGEGDIIYTWYGTATADGNNWKLSAAAYTTVEVTGTIKVKNSTTMFLPDTGFKMNSTQTGAVSRPDQSAMNQKIMADLLNRCFLGATLEVSGTSIVKFSNITLNSNWD